jgi:hypothetical protein
MRPERLLTAHGARSSFEPMKWLLAIAGLGLQLACTGTSQEGSGTAGSTTGVVSPVIVSCSQTTTTQAFASCSLSNPCGCPMGCVADADFASPVCEARCADPCPGTMALPGTSASALPTASACVDGYCRLDACAFMPSGAAAPGSYDGLCQVVAPNDGTCFPTGEALPDGGVLQWGICLLGNPEGGCPSDFDPTCPAGGFCIAGGCRPACDPTVTQLCTDGAPCQSFPDALNPHAGYCGPSCSLNGQACGETCCDPLSACTGRGTGTGGSNGICNPGG